MYKWKERCLTGQANTKMRIEKCDGLIKNIKQRLSEEKEKATKTIKAQLQNQPSDDKTKDESNRTLVSYLTKAYDGRCCIIKLSLHVNRV